MIDSETLLKELQSLAQLDIDAIHAYTAAIDRIDLNDVKNKLMVFRKDHERHVTDLAPHIGQLGGVVPTRTPDFKGFILQGFTAIRSMISNESALKAMKTNEELTNKNYAKALELEFPQNIKEVIQRNRDDELHHLEFINHCINVRVWEHPERTVA